MESADAMASDASGSSNWYRRKFGTKPTCVLAPMVDQSELSFRILCLRHGADLCYSPMMSSHQFTESAKYRDSMFGPLDGMGEDRPLVVQFAGNDPQVLLAAAKHVQHRCDAVDINFGCPQKIARRGHYGAWLSDEPHLQQQLVGTLHCHLDCPVTVKIRVQEAGNSATVDYARMLQSAGASVIAVHGRTREQRGAAQGAASWAAIAAVKAAVSVPVIANGGIFSQDDVARCLEATGADGVMAGESLLENPSLFSGGHVGYSQPGLAREYLALQATHPSPLAGVKQHLFAMLYAHVQVWCLSTPPAPIRRCPYRPSPPPPPPVIPLATPTLPPPLPLAASHPAILGAPVHRCTPTCVSSSTAHAPWKR